MPEINDPRRPDHIAFLRHRVKMTRMKTNIIEKSLFKYINETTNSNGMMDKFIEVISCYGTEESGETGALLRAFARILQQASSHQKVRAQMMAEVGTNLHYLRQVYRKAKETMEDYRQITRRYALDKKRYAAMIRIFSSGRSVRMAKDTVTKTESELFVKKGILKKELDEFDSELRKALLNFFLKFIKCEMYLAARILETYSESHSKLDRWNEDAKNIKEWVVKHQKCFEDK